MSALSDILGSAKNKRRGKKLFDGRNVCNSRKIKRSFLQVSGEMVTTETERSFQTRWEIDQEKD